MRKEYADQLYSGDARTGQRRDSDRRQTGFPNTGLRNWPRESLLYRRFTSGLFPYTVEQVVLMGRNAYSRALSGPEAIDRKMVKKVLERTGIAHLSQRPYTRISGGEMQLVMLARALVQHTSVIIMDEPSAHLDFRNELIFLENAARLMQGAVRVGHHGYPFAESAVFLRAGGDSRKKCWLSAEELFLLKALRQGADGENIAKFTR